MSRKRQNSNNDDEPDRQRQRRMPEDTTQLIPFRSQMEESEEPEHPLQQQEIIEQLIHLGSQINLAAEQNIDINAEQNQRSQTITANLLNALDDALDDAFTSTKKDVRRRQRLREATESKGMEMNEQREASESKGMEMDEQRQPFEQNLARLRGIMTSQNTLPEQFRMYNTVLERLAERMEEDIRAQTQEQLHLDPNRLNRISQLVTEIYNCLLEIVGGTLTNVYNSSVVITRQTVAVLISLLLLYSNFTTENIRNQLENIPYFGLLFATMNRYNSIIITVSSISSSPTILTTVYSSLRNMGGQGFTRNIIAGTTVMANAIKNTCLRAGCTVGKTINNAANNLLNIAGQRLGELIHSDYTNIQLNDSDSDSSSQRSRLSMEAQQSVHEFLTTPYEEGGVSLNPIPAINQQEIIEERFEALIDGNPNDPIIEGEENNINLSNNSSQDSTVSDLTQDISQDSTVGWNYPPKNRSSNGGRRLRKSRRHLKFGKTKKRKGKKVKINRLTRKSKRNYKTMKHNRQRMRK
jgi:hypothetical protein